MSDVINTYNYSSHFTFSSLLLAVSVGLALGGYIHLVTVTNFCNSLSLYEHLPDAHSAGLGGYLRPRRPLSAGSSSAHM